MMPNLIAVLAIASLLLQTPAIDSTSPKERQAAIEQMAKPGNKDAIPALAAALKKEPKSDIRAAILAALGRIRDRSAIPVIADAMHTDPDKDVRLEAIEAMLHLYLQADDSGPLHTIFNRVKSTIVQPDPPVIGPDVQVDASAKEALAQTLQKDFNDEVRVAAVRALYSLKATDQLPVLLATLDDPRNAGYPDVRIAVIRTLGFMRDPTTGPSLEKTLHDSNKAVVAEGATAIGLVGDKNARQDLENLFVATPDRMGADHTIRRNSLEALSLLRDQGSAALFESLLASPDDYYREVSAEGLARLKHDPKILKDRYDLEKKDNVRNALAYGLAASGQNDYINVLANALDSRQDYQAEAYLYELGKFDGKLTELYRYLGSSNPKVRAKMVRVIGNIGDPSSRDQVQALTNDSNVDVAREAVAALRKLSS